MGSDLTLLGPERCAHRRGREVVLQQVDVRRFRQVATLGIQIVIRRLNRMFPIGPPELSTDASLARLHLETFSETHRGGRPGGPSYEVRERQWREAFDRQDGSWFCYVIENDDGELVGFAKGTPHDGGVPGYAGELNKIYLLQRVQRQKLGRRLLRAVASRFIERGVTSMLLFGDAANRRTVSTRRSAPTARSSCAPG